MPLQLLFCQNSKEYQIKLARTPQATRSETMAFTLRRMREGPEKRQRDKDKPCNMKTATLNIGTLTGKSREIEDMMNRRRIDILCLQETRWTGGKSGGEARNLRDGVKLY